MKLIIVLAFLALANAELSLPKYDEIKLVNQVKQCLTEQDKVNCVANALGGDLVEAKQKAEALLNSADEKIIAFLKAKGEQIHQIIESKTGGFLDKVQDKAKEVKDKAQAWFNQHFGQRQKRSLDALAKFKDVLADLQEYLAFRAQGHTLQEYIESKLNRQKRDLPTPADVQLAKQVKICMDMTGDETPVNCLAKILGENHGEVDLVKLQTIAKYEDVLAELKEYFVFKAQGHTLKEFIEYKKQQTQKPKTRLINVNSLVPAVLKAKHVIEQCLKAIPDKDYLQCAISFFGPQATVAKDTIEKLVNTIDPQVIELVKQKAPVFHELIEKQGGWLDKLHDTAHEVYNFVSSYLG